MSQITKDALSFAASAYRQLKDVNREDSFTRSVHSLRGQDERFMDWIMLRTSRYFGEWALFEGSTFVATFDARVLAELCEQEDKARAERELERCPRGGRMTDKTIPSQDRLKDALEGLIEAIEGHAFDRQFEDDEESDVLIGSAANLDRALDCAKEVLAPRNLEMVNEASNEALTDRIDLMVDEFKRIRALVPSDTEIANLCDRAIVNAVQRVPVIEQRDRAEAHAKAIERAACDLIYAGQQLKRDPSTAPAWDAAVREFLTAANVPMPIICHAKAARITGPIERNGNLCGCVYKCGDATGLEDKLCCQPHGLLRPEPNEPPVGPRIGQTKCSRCKGRGYVETYNGDVHCPECNPSVDSLRTEGR